MGTGTSSMSVRRSLWSTARMVPSIVHLALLSLPSCSPPTCSLIYHPNNTSNHDPNNTSNHHPSNSNKRHPNCKYPSKTSPYNCNPSNPNNSTSRYFSNRNHPNNYKSYPNSTSTYQHNSRNINTSWYPSNNTRTNNQPSTMNSLIME